MADTTTRLGRWLRAARALRGHTQTDAAALLGVSTQTVSVWESGGLPGVDGLLALRMVYGATPGLVVVSLDDLAEWARTPAEEEATP